MKLLFDQNLSHGLVERLADLFPSSTQTRLIGLERAPDKAIWDLVVRDGYAIVSRDGDFAEMAALDGPPPLVIWLRGGNSTTSAVEAVLRRHHAAIVAAADEGELACLEVA